MKYTSKTGQDIILDGKIYVCGKDNVVDLPKKYDHPDLELLTETVRMVTPKPAEKKTTNNKK